MIIISNRKDFDDADNTSTRGHRIKEIDLQTDVPKSGNITATKLISMVANKRVLLLMHGYNNEQEEVHDAYAVIERKIKHHLQNEYDLILGYSWPGGDGPLDWWAAKSRANATGRRLRYLLEKLSDAAKHIDLMSHSLGARVVLKALKDAKKQAILRNYFCTAAAVDNECIESGEEFHASVAGTNRLFVFHSVKDGVLSTVYRTAELDNALGLCGPEDYQYIQNKTKNIFVVNCKKRVKRHGGYKHSDAVYKYIKMVLNASYKPRKFKTLS